MSQREKEEMISRQGTSDAILWREIARSWQLQRHSRKASSYWILSLVEDVHFPAATMAVMKLEV
jgi:hypothetical protein